MATQEECAHALARLADGLRSGERGSVSSLPDRSLSCTVTDLAVTFSGRLEGGDIVDMTTDAREKAQIRLTLASDDLVALSEGNLKLAAAWAKGQVKIDASFMDLLKLRSLA